MERFRVVRERSQTRISRQVPVPDPHDHVVFHLSSGRVVVFNDPRRFGIMELVPAGKLDRHAVLSRLGPEPLSGEFDGAALARSCHRKKTSLKAALMDQRVVAGLGNIYVVEALHVAGLSPQRRASTIATRLGAPRDAAHRLASAIKRVLEEAIARQSRSAYGDARFLVYDREGERCSTPGCTGTIRKRVQAGRSTFYCPACQR
jgi:formamidopyrimidine-DNA glycosylase